jgi:hypothetical protein
MDKWLKTKKIMFLFIKTYDNISIFIEKSVSEVAYILKRTIINKYLVLITK